MTLPAGEQSSTGLEANLAAALAYFGVFVTGGLLLLLEKQSRFVRFHAMQSTVFFGAFMVLSVLVNSIFFLGAILYAFVLFPAATIVWLVLMFKAYNGERFKLPVVGDFAERLI